MDLGGPFETDDIYCMGATLSHLGCDRKSFFFCLLFLRLLVSVFFCQKVSTAPILAPNLSPWGGSTKSLFQCFWGFGLSWAQMAPRSPPRSHGNTKWIQNGTKLDPKSLKIHGMLVDVLTYFKQKNVDNNQKNTSISFRIFSSVPSSFSPHCHFVHPT